MPNLKEEKSIEGCTRRSRHECFVTLECNPVHSRHFIVSGDVFMHFICSISTTGAKHACS
uniref:Uncharacterized protein n=1 Tax=Medicago truncatula TaxID=3880 RepID=B7FFM7_MEDTR|nr:unknown [Medicago truncatula]